MSKSKFCALPIYQMSFLSDSFCFFHFNIDSYNRTLCSFGPRSCSLTNIHNCNKSNKQTQLEREKSKKLSIDIISEEQQL